MAKSSSERLIEAIMRCIFCKKDSSGSISCEHIIPESLGNSTQILPAGVVCDTCNNYFSRKVEKPFLESGGIQKLRSFRFVPSKKGKIPSLIGYMGEGNPVRVFPQKKGLVKATIAVDSHLFEQLLQKDNAFIAMPTGSLPTDQTVVSRFLAKMAIEVLAQRLIGSGRSLQDYLIDNKEFDEIRDHARIGKPKKWEYHSRRIYDAGETRIIDENNIGKVTYEYNLLFTPQNEWYFVIALYGVELSINVGGPHVDGYREWLDTNYGMSPLFSSLYVM